MRLPVGTKVMKKACPDACNCDGYEIPPGTLGITEREDEGQMREYAVNGRVVREPYYLVHWRTSRGPRAWWTFGHGIQLLDDASIPDTIYLEGL